MKNKQSKKKNLIKVIFNFSIIVLVLALVLYYSLKDNYQEILNAILSMNKFCLLIAIFLLIIYRLLASLCYYYVVKINNEDISLKRCLQINFIIPFFHGVTPFAGGGQPMEIYYLHQEKISISKSTNIVLQNFIIYQISLVAVGVLSLIYNAYFHLFPSDHFIKHLVVVGFIINLVVLLVSFILSFSTHAQNLLIKLINWLTNILGKFKILKNQETIKNKVTEYLASFHNNAVKLSKNKKLVLNLILLNILNLCVLYSMPYAIAKGMHLNISLFDAITATSYVMIIGSFVPIPGGTGGIEYGFIFFFNYLIKGNIVKALMLVWRFISYYLAMILGAIVLSVYRKRCKNCE